MLFISTGGTIDKQPVFLPDGSFDNDSKVFSETHLTEMLEKAKFLGPINVEILFMLDSRDMTDEHRQQLAESIEASPESGIIITHGTDTMPETARFLERNPNLVGKTIVLTGAMIPYSMGESSDALFNLGCAIAFAQTLRPGVYIAMNGQAFDANNVRKDVEAGVFRTL